MTSIALLKGEGMVPRIARGMLGSPKASIAFIVCLVLILAALYGVSALLFGISRPPRANREMVRAGD